MNIKSTTTVAQLQVELAKLGIDNMFWHTARTNHVVRLEGCGRHADGFGQTMVEALDDAITSFVQMLGSELMRAD